MKSPLHVLRFAAIVSLISGIFPAGLAAQTPVPASCNFTTFTLADSLPQGDFVLGINKFSTTVGAFENTDTSTDAFIRYSGGHLNFFAPGAEPTWINARNDAGESVGVEDTVPNPISFLLHGTSGVTSIIHPNAVKGTFAQGLNKWDSVVGYYLDANNMAHGFKQWSNGSFDDVNYPNALQTIPMGINDSGAIAGSYVDSLGTHGFIFANGNWKSIDYPTVAVGKTMLNGISNANTAVGLTNAIPPGTSFLYFSNGVYKSVSVPKSAGGTFANGIATNGLIAGDYYLSSDKTSQHGFIAQCQ
ncbi:MAG TPA: hypothetical protein VJO35_02570 [Terriglobales bacterium]|nr:hypothetical protein [Terriglobales bacterium]